jgi:hypothetical protein
MPPEAGEAPTCLGTTGAGNPCRWRARPDSDWCERHDPDRDTTRAQIGEHELLKRYPMLVDETQPPAAGRLIDSDTGSMAYIGGGDYNWRGLPLVEAEEEV